jgi:uncharacterized membrane protein
MIPDLTSPTVADILTLGGITATTALIVFVIMNTANLTTEAANRFGPLIAVATGLVVSLGFTFLLIPEPQRPDLAQAILNGLFGGLASIGTYQLIKKTFLGKPST